MTGSADLSAAIGRHIAGARFEQLPAATVHAARRALLDAVGVMRAASGLAPEVKPFIELALAQEGRAEATILGVERRAPAALAAFANGAMAHALDYEDAFDAAPVHPNASLIPAVLALAEARAPVRGAELLTAIAVGCDLTCRLALALECRLEDRGWYPPPILGAFGAVAGAARLLRLSPDQVVDAFSLVLLQNSAPGEIKHSADTVIRAVREAFPAQAAVVCAQLAARGVRGFEQPFEGRAGFYSTFAGGRFDAGTVVRDLGERWLIEELSFKPWPCCRGTHAAVELALQLRDAHGIESADVASIVVEGGAVQAMLASPLERKRAPRTAIDAKFSLPFTIATALAHGDVQLHSFDATRLQDPQVLALAARTTFRQRDDWGPDEAAAGALEIALRDGRALRAELREPRGSPARPLDDEALVRKYVDCAGCAAVPESPRLAEATARKLLAVDRATDVVHALR